MKKLWIPIVLVAALLMPVAAIAHEGHTHKILGTVTAIQDGHVTVKTTDGKLTTIMLDAKTTVTRGKDKLDATAIKVGERISVDAMQEKDMLMAQAVKLSTVTPAKK